MAKKPSLVGAAREQQTVTKNEVATVDASTVVPVAPDASAMLMLNDLPYAEDDIMERTGFQTPYVVFATARSPKQWTALVRAFPDVNEGETYLILPDPTTPVFLHPCQFVLLFAKQYFVKSADDEKGTILAVSRTIDRALGIDKEQIETLILVTSTPTIVPARMTFKTAKCPAIHKVKEHQELATTPEWSAKGGQYTNTMKIPDPRYRLISSLKTSKKTAVESGRAYVLAEAIIRPTEMTEWAKFGEFMKDQESLELFNATYAAYNKRIAWLDGVCAGRIKLKPIGE